MKFYKNETDHTLYVKIESNRYYILEPNETIYYKSDFTFELVTEEEYNENKED